MSILGELGETLRSFIEDLDVTPSVKAYLWTPFPITGGTPVAVVELPAVERTIPGERESQIGSDDWTVTFPIIFYFEARDAELAQIRAAEVVEAFISAVDADPGLSDPTVVDDSSVTSAVPEFFDDENQALFAYVCEVRVIKQVIPN